MKKQALLAMMLALALILSGCTLVQKDPKVDAATEIIRLGDAVVTKGEIQEEVQNQLNYMNMLYSMYYGASYDTTAAENIAAAQDAVVESFKTRLASNAKAAELGLDKLTEEEEAQVKTDAEKAFQNNLDSVISANYTDSEMTDEEKKEKATADLATQNYTLETALENARETLVNDKLRAEIIKDVAVTEEELKAEYDSRVASAKETYENNAASWTTAANNGTTLYYTPAGVRYVKQILIKFLEEDQAKIDAANEAVTAAQTKADAAANKQTADQEVLDNADASQEDKDAAQADLETAKTEAEAAAAELEAARKEAAAALEAGFANLDAAADDVLAQLEAGADWDTLMAEKNQDPGMQSGVTAERGYAVSADMTSFDAAFVQAAMALEKIGDVSGKIRGDAYGYYIIKYVADAQEGAIALDEVKDTIESSLLSTKQNDTYTSAQQSWVDAADFKLDLNALKN